MLNRTKPSDSTVHNKCYTCSTSEPSSLFSHKKKKNSESQEHLIKSWGWEQNDLDIQPVRGWYSSSLITGLSVITRGFTCNPGCCSRLSIITPKYVRSAAGGSKATCTSRVPAGVCETVCCCRPRALLRDDYLSVHVVSAALSLALMLGGNTLHNNSTAWPQHCGTVQRFQKYIEIKSYTISCDISTIIWKDRDRAVVRPCCWGQCVCVQQGSEQWPCALIRNRFWSEQLGRQQQAAERIRGPNLFING